MDTLVTRCRRKIRGLIGGMVGFAVAAIPSSQAAANPWLKLQANDFVVYSDASEKHVVECALKYAAYRSAFSELLVEPGATLPPATLVLFRTKKNFDRHLADREPTLGELVNSSFEVDGGSVSAFALAGDRDQALQLTFEFETIRTMRRIGYAVPLWMSQGTGAVLSTVTLKKGECWIGYTGERFFASEFTWPDFFSVSEASAAYREPRRLGDYLSQAWGFMHWFLLSEPNARERFQRLGQQLQTTPALAAVETVTATPEGRLAKAVRRHLLGFSPRTVPFDEAKTRASFVITPAPEAEVAVQRSDLLAANGRTLEAEVELDRARALAPQLAVVQEAWARRMLRENRENDAARAYRDAIANGSRNFTAYLRSAVMRLDDNRTFGEDRAGQGGQGAVLALAEIRQAIRLNPGSEEAYRMLGRALFVCPEVIEADVVELSAGVRTGEAGQRVRMYRALLHARLGHHDEYAVDLRAVIADPESPPQLVALANQWLLSELMDVTSKKVEARVQARDYAGARAIIAEAEAATTEPALLTGLTRLRAWLARQEARIEAAAEK